MKKLLCVSIATFLLGWSACLGLLSFNYHYNFTTGGDGDLPPMLSAFIMKQCRDETKVVLADVVKNKKDTNDYVISAFDCQNSKTKKLVYKMSMDSAGFEYLACTTKAEKEGGVGSAHCKQILEQKIAILKVD